MARYSFSCFLCALSMVSEPSILSATLAMLISVCHQVGWVLSLNVYGASGRCLLFCCSSQTGSNPTPNASAARQLFLLSWSNPFNLQKPAFSSKSLWQPRRITTLSYAALVVPLLYAPVDPEISSSSLPLVARRPSSFFHRFFCLVRFGRSSCFIPLFDSFANVLFPHSSCCTTVRFLFAFSLSGLLFTCYRCICFTPIPLLSKPVYLCRGIHTLSCLLPTSSAFARFRFFASRFICLNCVFNVGPYLDAYVGSLRPLVCVESFSLTS